MLGHSETLQIKNEGKVLNWEQKTLLDHFSVWKTKQMPQTVISCDKGASAISYIEERIIYFNISYVLPHYVSEYYHTLRLHFFF